MAEEKTFDQIVEPRPGEGLRCHSIDMIQVNIGLRCNMECVHCHVASGPWRKEEMNWETMVAVLSAARRLGCSKIDITGGAPEINPNFRRFIDALASEGIHANVRTNLTILLEPGYEDLPEFTRDRKIELTASLPCYLQENVDRQRGEGAYRRSVEAILRLNAVGYGKDPDLPLNLIYNPIGPVLPPDQKSLEEDYRRELKDRFGLEFTSLLTITNMRIGRFMSDLKREKRDEDYRRLLRDAYNEATVNGLMCRRQISVNWDGSIFDCDFNLALRQPVDHGAPNHISRFDANALARRRIVTGEHCFGCTAGCGSSCGGSLV